MILPDEVPVEPGEKPSSATHTIRAVELLDAASDWKVVAAPFTEVRSLERLRESLGPIPSPAPSGPLMKFLAAPDELAASLSADPVVVFGTDKAERAIGQAAAKALLSKWWQLPLAIEEGDKVREVRCELGLRDGRREHPEAGRGAVPHDRLPDRCSRSGRLVVSRCGELRGTVADGRCCCRDLAFRVIF